MGVVDNLSPDSPAVPVSATSKELFRGFSYIAPTLDDVSNVICVGFLVKICGGS